MNLCRGSVEWLVLDELPSTNVYAKELIKSCTRPLPTIILARHQTMGMGRRGRTWYSEYGRSLTATWIASEYDQSSKPWLLGMVTAIAAAEFFDCSVSWPNDLMIGSKKVGGILTEVVKDTDDRCIPIVGIGVNLGIKEFPTTLCSSSGNVDVLIEKEDVVPIARKLFQAIENFPDPNSWNDIAQRWLLRDSTKGKSYRLLDGRALVAIRIGDEGELIGYCEGAIVSALAADALQMEYPV